MRTVSKSLITMSMCLGLSGAVYAQATPNVAKPVAPTAEAAKQKPAVNHVVKESKDKPAAISGESATPAVKSPKQPKSDVTKPAAVKKPVESANKPADKVGTEHKAMKKHEASKSAEKVSTEAPKPVK